MHTHSFVVIIIAVVYPVVPVIAQPLKAADELAYPVNPPRPVIDPKRVPPVAPATPLAPSSTPQLLVPVNKDGYSVDISTTASSSPSDRDFRISLQRDPPSHIDTKSISIEVRPYDKATDGQITLTESKTNSRWASSPVDFSSPELLEVTILQASESLHGIVVALYVDGRLMAAASHPDDLIRMFPPRDTK